MEVRIISYEGINLLPVNFTTNLIYTLYDKFRYTFVNNLTLALPYKVNQCLLTAIKDIEKCLKIEKIDILMVKSFKKFNKEVIK